MDPYLECHWRDVHADFVCWIRRMLNDCLPTDLLARIDERVVVDDDLRDVGNGPIECGFEQEEHSETDVAIRDAEDGNLITVIEFLSPTNKRPGSGRDEYRRKRDELAQTNVNLVEVDLIREGSWRDMLSPVPVPAQAETPYRVLVRRSQQKHRVELYPITLRQPLPVFRVPLRAADADAVIDLQKAFENVYTGGRYDHTDYHRPCQPPLEGDDATWADELLRKAGRR